MIKQKLIWRGKDAKLSGVNTLRLTNFELGVYMQSIAVPLCPRDTSRLAGSITVKDQSKIEESPVAGGVAEDIITAPVKDLTALIGTLTPYGEWVEFGTREQTAQPFMRPAVDLAKGEIIPIGEKNGKKEFRDYS